MITRRAPRVFTSARSAASAPRGVAARVAPRRASPSGRAIRLRGIETLPCPARGTRECSRSGRRAWTRTAREPWYHPCALSRVGPSAPPRAWRRTRMATAQVEYVGFRTRETTREYQLRIRHADGHCDDY